MDRAEGLSCFKSFRVNDFGIQMNLKVVWQQLSLGFGLVLLRRVCYLTGCYRVESSMSDVRERLEKLGQDAPPNLANISSKVRVGEVNEEIIKR